MTNGPENVTMKQESVKDSESATLRKVSINHESGKQTLVILLKLVVKSLVCIVNSGIPAGQGGV